MTVPCSKPPHSIQSHWEENLKTYYGLQAHLGWPLGAFPTLFRTALPWLSILPLPIWPHCSSPNTPSVFLRRALRHILSPDCSAILPDSHNAQCPRFTSSQPSQPQRGLLRPLYLRQGLPTLTTCHGLLVLLHLSTKHSSLPAIFLTRP